MIRIYGIDWRTLPRAEELFSALRSDLRAVALSRYEKTHTQDQLRAGLAGLLLLQASGADGTLRYDENGRPFFLEGKADFNISHTRTMTFCAVNDGETPPDIRVGLDAEDGDRLSEERLASLAKRWFSEQEQSRFFADPTPHSFLTIWTGKEAMVKYSGEGLRALSQADTDSADKIGLCLHSYSLADTVITLCARQGVAVCKEISVCSSDRLIQK